MNKDKTINYTDLLKKLDSMMANSFEGWTDGERNGYITAVTTIREFIKKEPIIKK